MVETDWFQNRFPLHNNAHALFPLASVNSLNFDQAIKSAISTRQDQNIKEITSLQKKLILAFLIENAIHLRAFRQATGKEISDLSTGRSRSH